MKQYLILFLVALPLLSFATGKDESKALNPNSAALPIQSASLEGIVIDTQTGEPLPGVKVEIKELNVEVFTDFDGMFKLDKIEKGNYDIEVSFVSYEVKLLERQPIENPATSLTIKL